MEILVGTEYHTSNLLEADGRIRWTVRGGPGFTALALADLNGDGLKEAIYGTLDGNVVACHPISGSILWSANLGDDVRHGVVLPGGTGLVAGSESGNVLRLGRDGRKHWRLDLGAPITGLARVQNAGNTVIAAGTSEGWIAVLSPEGKTVCTHRMADGVTKLGAIDQALLVGLESGEVVALSWD